MFGRSLLCGLSFITKRFCVVLPCIHVHMYSYWFLFSSRFVVHRERIFPRDSSVLLVREQRVRSHVVAKESHAVVRRLRERQLALVDHSAVVERVPVWLFVVVEMHIALREYDRGRT
jgi:hypothetical protein